MEFHFLQCIPISDSIEPDIWAATLDQEPLNILILLDIWGSLIKEYLLVYVFKLWLNGIEQAQLIIVCKQGQYFLCKGSCDSNFCKVKCQYLKVVLCTLVMLYYLPPILAVVESCLWDTKGRIRDTIGNHNALPPHSQWLSLRGRLQKIQLKHNKHNKHNNLAFCS